MAGRGLLAEGKLGARRPKRAVRTRQLAGSVVFSVALRGLTAREKTGGRPDDDDDDDDDGGGGDGGDDDDDNVEDDDDDDDDNDDDDDGPNGKGT